MGREDEESEARTERILASAAALASEGGFEAVRIRDVAARADVALGTLYKRFRGKDEILMAVLERELGHLETAAEWFRAQGRESYLARALAFFDPVTQGLCARERFTGAVLRAVVSGEAGITDKVGRFHARVTDLIVAALHGTGDAPAAEPRALSADEERELAYILSQVWFAALVGWMGGLHTPADVVARVDRAGTLLLRGLLGS